MAGFSFFVTMMFWEGSKEKCPALLQPDISDLTREGRTIQISVKIKVIEKGLIVAIKK
jgi:hypothetical protein